MCEVRKGGFFWEKAPSFALPEKAATFAQKVAFFLTVWEVLLCSIRGRVPLGPKG